MRSTTTPVRPATFFGLAFLLSWLIWIPLVLSHFAVGPLHIPEDISSIVRLLGVLMPAVTALLLTAWVGGRTAVRDLLDRLTLWRVGWQWWVVAVVTLPAALIGSGLTYNWLGGNPPVTPLSPVSPVALVVNVVFLALATLGEEIGWRGVALPALQRRRSALAASAILGLMGAAWHIPFWLLLDTFDQFGVGYLVLNLLLVLPMTAYITWFFNHTRASVLLPVAFHLSFNIVNVAWLPITTSIGAFGLFIAVLWGIAFLILRHLEPKREHPREQ
jgi:membrane protease YdiL (CAAX protease family)